MRRILTASIMSLLTVLAGLTLAAQPASAAPICKYERFEKLPAGHAMCRDGVENIIWAAGKHYVLKMQSDGNFVFYHLAEPGNQLSADRVVWAWTNAGAGAFVVMEYSGSLRYKRANGDVVREYAPYGDLNWLKVQADGKLVIYSKTDVPKAESCVQGHYHTFCPIF